MEVLCTQIQKLTLNFKMTLLLSGDFSNGDFSLLPPATPATFLEMKALIFSIIAVLSGVASVFCIPEDFLFKFLFLERGGAKPQPRRLASLECTQGPLSRVLQPRGPVGTPEPRGVCLPRQLM